MRIRFDGPRVRPRRAQKSLTPGHVQLESVEQWRSECADHRTPESLLIAHEEEFEARARNDRHSSIVAGLPQHEAAALTLADGLFGQRVHTVRQIALLLVATEAEISGILASARRRAERLRVDAENVRGAA